MARFGDKLYTRKEVADIFRVHTHTIACWAKPETAPYGIILKPIKLSRRCVRYTAEAIEECLRQRDMHRERIERRYGQSRRFKHHRAS